MSEQQSGQEPLPRHRVSVTVFAEVDAVDERDAGYIVEHAVWTALAGGARSRRDVVIPVPLRQGQETRQVRVAEVMETGMAAGNGYL